MKFFYLTTLSLKTGTLKFFYLTTFSLKTATLKFLPNNIEFSIHRWHKHKAVHFSNASRLQVKNRHNRYKKEDRYEQESVILDKTQKTTLQVKL